MQNWESKLFAMTIDLGKFLHDALDQLEHTSSVDVFYHQFEAIRSLVSSVQPWLPEAYFASRFVYGLREDIQRYVISFQPVTVRDAFWLACIYESKSRQKNNVETVECVIMFDLSVTDMGNDISNFLQDALDDLQQLSCLDEFYNQFEVIRSLASFIEPGIPESYFTDRFIYGLCEEIQRYVIQFHPCTVLDAYHLAALYEYSRLPTDVSYVVIDASNIYNMDVESPTSSCNDGDNDSPVASIMQVENVVEVVEKEPSASNHENIESKLFSEAHYSDIHRGFAPRGSGDLSASKIQHYETLTPWIHDDVCMDKKLEKRVLLENFNWEPGPCTINVCKLSVVYPIAESQLAYISVEEGWCAMGDLFVSLPKILNHACDPTDFQILISIRVALQTRVSRHAFEQLKGDSLQVSSVVKKCLDFWSFDPLGRLLWHSRPHHFSTLVVVVYSISSSAKFSDSTDVSVSHMGVFLWVIAWTIRFLWWEYYGENVEVAGVQVHSYWQLFWALVLLELEGYNVCSATSVDNWNCWSCDHDILSVVREPGSHSSASFLTSGLSQYMQTIYFKSCTKVTTYPNAMFNGDGRKFSTASPSSMILSGGSEHANVIFYGLGLQRAGVGANTEKVLTQMSVDQAKGVAPVWNVDDKRPSCRGFDTFMFHIYSTLSYLADGSSETRIQDALIIMGIKLLPRVGRPSVVTPSASELYSAGGQTVSSLQHTSKCPPTSTILSTFAKFQLTQYILHCLPDIIAASLLAGEYNMFRLLWYEAITNSSAVTEFPILVTLQGWPPTGELQPFGAALSLSSVPFDINISSAYVDMLHSHWFGSMGFSSSFRSVLRSLLCADVYGMCSSAVFTIKDPIAQGDKLWMHIHTYSSGETIYVIDPSGKSVDLHILKLSVCYTSSQVVYYFGFPRNLKVNVPASTRDLVSRLWHIVWSAKMILHDILDPHRVMVHRLHGHPVSHKVSFLWMVIQTVGSFCLMQLDEMTLINDTSAIVLWMIAWHVHSSISTSLGVSAVSPASILMISTFATTLAFEVSLRTATCSVAFLWLIAWPQSSFLLSYCPKLNTESSILGRLSLVQSFMQTLVEKSISVCMEIGSGSIPV